MRYGVPGSVAAGVWQPGSSAPAPRAVSPARKRRRGMVCISVSTSTFMVSPAFTSSSSFVRAFQTPHNDATYDERSLSLLLLDLRRAHDPGITRDVGDEHLKSGTDPYFRRRRRTSWMIAELSRSPSPLARQPSISSR